MAVLDRATLKNKNNNNFDNNGVGGITGTEHNEINNDIIDSHVNKTSDAWMLGLRDYNTGVMYLVGMTALYNNTVYKCTSPTSGAFDASKWTVSFSGFAGVSDGYMPVINAGVASDSYIYQDSYSVFIDPTKTFKSISGITGNVTEMNFNYGSGTRFLLNYTDGVTSSNLRLFKDSAVLNGQNGGYSTLVGYNESYHDTLIKFTAPSIQVSQDGVSGLDIATVGQMNAALGNYLPLSGNYFGTAMTGAVKVSGGGWQIINDSGSNGTGYLTLGNEVPSMLSYDATGTYYSQIGVSANWSYASVSSNKSNFSGLLGSNDFSANYVPNSFVQKVFTEATYLQIANYTDASVTSKILTGLNVTGSSISSSDTILQAFGKIQNQINGVLGGAIYQGVYNATTNSPTLVDGTGTQGHYYVVNVAGNQNFGSGVINFNVGDWAIYNGSIWQKVDNTDAVSSVNGHIGAVSLTTADISEVANLYFTNARVDTQLGTYTGDVTFAAGSLSIGVGKVTNAMLFGSIAYSKLSLAGSILYSDLAAMTSANLAGIISDETGSDKLVFSNAPTLVNPIVGTQSQNDNSTKAASTSYTDTAVANAVVDLDFIQVNALKNLYNY